MGLEKLWSRSSNLLTADGVFYFIFSEINQLNPGFAKDVKLSLEKSLNERCNVRLIALMQYLNLGQKYDKTEVLNVVIQHTPTVFTRLFSEKDEF